MSIIGKIQGLFSDREKTQPIFPITKTKAVSDDNGVSLDALLEGKAPAGFGLGDAVLIYPEDLDNTTAPGWYHISGTMTINNITANYWYMTVVAYGNGEQHCIQKLYPISSSAFEVELVRARHSGTWYAWECDNPPLIIGKEYRTTDRYQDKPVYVKVIDGGTLPDTTSKEITHAVTNRDILVDIYGIVTNPDNGRTRVIPYASKSGEWSTIDLFAQTTGTSSFSIKLYCDQPISSWTCVLILKYTKSVN